MVPSHRQEHDRIRAICSRLGRHLDAAAMPTDADFARARWELARELGRHLALERPPAGARASAEVPLEDALRAHMSRWTGSAIAERWSEYRGAARALIRRTARNMEREERLSGLVSPA